jgi:hypothetical protein
MCRKLAVDERTLNRDFIVMGNLFDTSNCSIHQAMPKVKNLHKFLTLALDGGEW